MMILRPIQQSDYQALVKIAVESGHGFTSLPNNEELLQKKIDHSVSSFAKAAQQPGDEGYLFVLEDSETGEVVGTSGIEAAVGLDDAFYHYHLSKVIHSSRTLDVYKAVDILTLCNDYTGATELCTLFLKDGYRKNNNGKLLSKARFMFINQHRERFADTVIAEMRGVSDESGESPFWQWLEEHFFSMDFPTADYLTGIGQKVFIAELMPKYPIYVNLLSKDAQAVIGQVHDNTRPAIELLKSEGFTFNGYVDIFDAGPTVEAKVDNIATVRNAHTVKVEIGESQGDTTVLLANDKIADFRATVTQVSLSCDADSITISSELAKALHLEAGDSVSLAEL
ncbi:MULTISPECIES: arginine N-succinyltransferase [Pseudoalteromonas]|jgi:arginine N-succinyltransferase|uniref:Arginine N-succinyltransferase n=1 Tax=Pseudoalteromonas shioyasakiensis TaxID=1190813 RepID=A0ABT6U2M5_9GAMM|nr:MULTISPECIES: arginine N-succinyltransferase [Pseudoalteromonas]MDC3190321.1 arginine N-succinyltransferase [Pseudoalteromonas elyakovii]MEC8139597.1 arginine N-succinyltransferase [Pseudomonadota bacterium]KPV99645.1 Arginine N-succinyltransferase [Pseudoalteromonas sp. P1-8]KTG22137.1 arginine N-succinyltransferase [Pseudoalteromonas sp. XI10]MCG9735593.1 arginine N-succinyltransferase [Pseudoalteromonas shioyasakiensis]|tara:strand:+ start:1940 stop:2956 length:1017 start_codon:yes stop_codon:yes gene_type:complete